MKRGAMGVLAGCLALAPETQATGGKVVFYAGFEADCSPYDDVDLDRLSGCAEAGLKLDAANADTDGDGLKDGDEVLGTLSGLDLPAMGVDPRRKNILLEYDWFEDSLEPELAGICQLGITHTHQPTAGALDRLTAAFASAPVPNPDGSQGIDVIHDAGQGAAFSGGSPVPAGDGIVEGTASGAEYSQYMQQHFALNRRGYFHYVLLPHRYHNPVDNNFGSSGSAQYADGQRRERIMVSLNCNVTDARVASTVMHELGHNLGLLHGGDTFCNYKPNYNSILNYKFQFPGIDLDCDRFGDGVPDYSRGLRPVIDEHAVDERKGVCGNVPIDFTAQNGIEAAVVANLNSYGKELEECGAQLTLLGDHDDWGSIEIGVDATVGDSGGDPDAGAMTCDAP